MMLMKIWLLRPRTSRVLKKSLRPRQRSRTNISAGHGSWRPTTHEINQLIVTKAENVDNEFPRQSNFGSGEHRPDMPKNDFDVHAQNATGALAALLSDISSKSMVFTNERVRPPSRSGINATRSGTETNKIMITDTSLKQWRRRISRDCWSRWKAKIVKDESSLERLLCASCKRPFFHTH